MTRTISFRPSLAFVLLWLLLVALWLAGGASRGTADGQPDGAPKDEVRITSATVS